MVERTYLDWNATAPMREQARSAFADALGAIGNPSSVHAEGRAARRLVEQSRAQVAALVGAEPANVIFTSGGTEAERVGAHAVYRNRHHRENAARRFCSSLLLSILPSAPADAFRPR